MIKKQIGKVDTNARQKDVFGNVSHLLRTLLYEQSGVVEANPNTLVNQIIKAMMRQNITPTGNPNSGFKALIIAPKYGPTLLISC